MIHSVFGMRINGAWGMALREQVRRRFGLLAEASHVDDGILLSFAPGQVPPAPERLVTLVGPEDLDPLLGEALIGSPLFGTRFRHCAIRALFIPRMTRGQRTPAYLQRLKADALLESVRGQPDFPVVAETLRECFNDAYDVPRLKRLLERLHDGEMWVAPRGHAAALARSSTRCCWPGTGRTWTPATPRSGAADAVVDAQGVERGAGAAAARDRRRGRGRAAEDGARAARPRRQRAGGTPRRPRRPHRRGDRRAGDRRAGRADGGAARRAPDRRRSSSPADGAPGSPPPTPRSTPGWPPTPGSSAWRCACSAPGAR